MRNRLCSAKPHPQPSVKRLGRKHKLFGTPMSVAKGVGAFIVTAGTVAALYISILTYKDQHQVDTAAAIANQRHNAEQVYYWIQNSPGNAGARLMVENRSGGPISAVVLGAGVSEHGGATSYPAKTWYYLSDIPPCTVATTNVMQDIGLRKGDLYMSPGKGTPHKDVFLYLSYLQMSFTDPSGVAWTRMADGSLLRESPDYLFQHQYKKASATFVNANGCS